MKDKKKLPDELIAPHPEAAATRLGPVPLHLVQTVVPGANYNLLIIHHLQPSSKVLCSSKSLVKFYLYS